MHAVCSFTVIYFFTAEAPESPPPHSPVPLLLLQSSPNWGHIDPAFLCRLVTQPNRADSFQVYLPIFQTAGSVEVAVSMIGEHVDSLEAEEEPGRTGQHEIALRRAIAEDVTVGFVSEIHTVLVAGFFH